MQWAARRRICGHRPAILHRTSRPPGGIHPAQRSVLQARCLAVRSSMASGRTYGLRLRWRDSIRRPSLVARRPRRQSRLQDQLHRWLRDHLGRFALTFGRRVARQDPLGLYGALGNLCFAFIEMECFMLDIPVGPDALQLRTPVSDDSPMACSTCVDPMSESPDMFDAEQ